MGVATEPPTPSNHLALEVTGFTPSFGGTPGFFSAEFGALNPFDVDFQDATASPLRLEQSVGQTPPSQYSSTFSNDIPRAVADIAMRRPYDPSLVPTPGPRLGMTPFKSSGLKESTLSQESSTLPASQLTPSPERSPINPAFLIEKPDEYSTSNSFPSAHSGYGCSRGSHGQVTPPTDESRSPEDKYSSNRNKNTSTSSSPSNQKSKPTISKKRKPEPSDQPDTKFEREESELHEEDYSARTSSDHKRKKFLERNRLAASKCRQKKKEWANNLEEQARYQAQENKILRATVAHLRDECLYLKNFLLSAHAGCSCVGVKNYLMNEAQMSHVTSMNVRGASGGMPIANSGMDLSGRTGYIMGIQQQHHPHHTVDDRGRSESIASGITMSDGCGHQGSMSPQQ